LLRAVVFDFDGVIANSEPFHFRAYRDVLAQEGLALTEPEYYARYLGYDDVGAFNALAADRGVYERNPADRAGLGNRFTQNANAFVVRIGKVDVFAEVADKVVLVVFEAHWGAAAWAVHASRLRTFSLRTLPSTRLPASLA